MKYFESFGDYLVAVAAAEEHPGGMDDRLRQLYRPQPAYEAVATGSNQAIPSEGGFAVPVEFADSLWEPLFSTGALLGLCDRIEMKSSTLKIPAIGDTDRADGSRFGGLSMSWLGAGDEITATKPGFRAVQFNTRRLAGLTYSTSELWEDVPALEAILRRFFTLESVHRIEQEIIDGEGTRGPLGILVSPATIEIAKESGQAAATIVAENILAMWSRLWSASRRRAVWLVTDDAESQLAQAKLATGTALAELVTFQDGGMHLMGRPVVPLEQCPSLGTVGDIILCDPSQYIVGERSVRAESSIHVKFLTDENAFRFSVRLDGQPAWASTITPKNAAATQSPFVTLAVRA